MTTATIQLYMHHLLAIITALEAHQQSLREDLESATWTDVEIAEYEDIQLFIAHLKEVAQ